VQTTRDADFPQRMYVYNYRIHDRYNRDVASLAVLADDDPDWRPAEHRRRVFGCETGIVFPHVKLLDFVANEAVLEASINPFAPVVLAHLKTRETHGDSASRYAWKLRITRGLYERGFNAADVCELVRVIDWLMDLPSALAELFRQDLDKIQEEKRMPFVTSYERSARREGIRLGIKTALKIQFGEEGLKLMPEIQAIHEEEKLEAILTALETAASPDEVRQLYAPPTA
jgi:hypothetical protein